MHIIKYVEHFQFSKQKIGRMFDVEYNENVNMNLNECERAPLC